MWLFGGIITLSKVWVNIAAAKKATARNVSLPTLTRSCLTGVGIAKTLPGPTQVGVAIFHVQFSGASNDVLRLFGSVGVPAEAMPGLNFVHNRGRCGRAVAAIDGKTASPMN
jgi:hypothetical protein